MIKIDKKKIYESHGYEFKNFTTLSLEEKLLVLEWRNHDKVRSVMVNHDIISEKDHLKFIDSLQERDDCAYWLVTDSYGAKVGVLDLIHIDSKNNSGEIGYYINPDEAGNGFQFMIECLFFIYSQVKLGNNMVTINVNNRDILMFNKYIGTTFEGVERISNEYFYINRHTNGDYILQHYDEFSLLDYAKFVRKNKKSVLY